MNNQANSQMSNRANNHFPSHFRRKEALETISRSIINQYDPSLLHSPKPIPIEAIMEQKYGLILEYLHIRNNGRILGETVFEDALIPIYEPRNNEGYKLIPIKAGTVVIDASLLCDSKIGRYRFTCAHELAHWILDRDYFIQRGETAAMSKASKSSETDTIIERQADRMASLILMPKKTVKMAFHGVLNSSGSHGITSNTDKIITTLAEIFLVSRQAMRIRLEEMGLLA